LIKGIIAKEGTTQNCKSNVHEKGYRGHPLAEQQKESNTQKSKIRARVEHIFGFMTNSMNNGLFMRSIGIKRNQESLAPLNLTCSISLGLNS
jgi:hypothetical protein